MSKRFLTPLVPPKLPIDPVDAVEGAIYYNTVINSLKFFDGTTWSLIGAGGGGGSNTSFEVLDQPPSSPTKGRVYFNASEQTIKVYNGDNWYDVAGPKEILDHQHNSDDGRVNHVDYSTYVSENIIFMDGGTSSSTFIDNIIDGGSSQWQ